MLQRYIMEETGGKNTEKTHSQKVRYKGIQKNRKEGREEGRNSERDKKVMRN